MYKPKVHFECIVGTFLLKYAEKAAYDPCFSHAEATVVSEISTGTGLESASSSPLGYDKVYGGGLSSLLS